MKAPEPRKCSLNLMLLLFKCSCQPESLVKLQAGICQTLTLDLPELI